MLRISSSQDIQRTNLHSDEQRHNVPTRSSGRRRGSRRQARRRWSSLFRADRVITLGAVMLLLAAFVHVSMINDVFSPADSADDSLNILAYGYGAYYLDHSAYERSGSVASVTSTTPAYSVEVSRFSEDEPIDSTVQPAEEPVSRFTVYEVPEGGSLWRTGKRFITDEVLLDKLIDNLAAQGMDVGSVRAGDQFLVSDLGPEGLLVVIESGGRTYESRVFENDVITTMRRAATNEVSSLNTALLAQ